MQAAILIRSDPKTATEEAPSHGLNDLAASSDLMQAGDEVGVLVY